MHLNKRVFKEEISQVDMGFQRNTDMKTSRRVIFPPRRPAKEEAKIETRLEIWREVVRKYMEEKCKEGGKQEVNLEKNQIFGRMKLGKRVRKGEVYISPSDKGKGVVVMPLNMYAQMVETHTKKDQEVKWEELEERAGREGEKTKL